MCSLEEKPLTIIKVDGRWVTEFADFEETIGVNCKGLLTSDGGWRLTDFNLGFKRIDQRGGHRD